MNKKARCIKKYYEREMKRQKKKARQEHFYKILTAASTMEEIAEIMGVKLK